MPINSIDVLDEDSNYYSSVAQKPRTKRAVITDKQFSNGYFVILSLLLNQLNERDRLAAKHDFIAHFRKVELRRM